jgi:hypothetical protein
MNAVKHVPEPRVKPPKFDYEAAAAAGASPLLIFLHKAHKYLGLAYLVWMVLFVIGIILFHSLGKPAWLGDDVVVVLMTAWMIIWVLSQAAIFCSHVFIRKMYLATIPSCFLHGFLMLFPILNIVVILAMSPDLPGQTAPMKPKADPGVDRTPA